VEEELASSAYIQNRWDINGLRKRPQAIAWSDSPGVISNGLLVPEGIEYTDFIILSDHNRGEISFTKLRLENRQRMVSGFMRSYHIADKDSISWSWDMLPSRAFSGDPDFDENTGLANVSGLEKFTVDSGAGGVDIINWYENHPGSFYMFLAYDRYDNFTSDKYSRLNQYNEVIEVMFSGFEQSLVQRAGSLYDFWNISVTLEEV
jgi:hypothetical protein